jgi:hypothetical protein
MLVMCEEVRRTMFNYLLGRLAKKEKRKLKWYVLENSIVARVTQKMQGFCLEKKRKKPPFC